jgi:hypothetical protein
VARDFLSLACGRENCDKRRRECEAETGTNHPGFCCARIGLSKGAGSNFNAVNPTKQNHEN